MTLLDDGKWQEWRDRLLEATQTFSDLPPEGPEVMALLEEGGFWDDMQTDDLVGVLLRGHLWCQQALTQIVQLGASYPKYVPDRLGFAITVQLAASTGFLAESLVQPLMVLNRIRNRVAHELGATPSVGDERRLQESLPDGLALRFPYEGEAFPVMFIMAVVSLALVTTRCAVATRQLRLDVVGSTDGL